MRATIACRASADFAGLPSKASGGETEPLQATLRHANSLPGAKPCGCGADLQSIARRGRRGYTASQTPSERGDEMRVTQLTFLAFQLNGALGSGRYDNVSIPCIKKAIEDGTVLDFLDSRMGSDIDLSLLEESDRAELLKEWRSVVNAVDENRKMCVEKNGLCLLVAYLLEGIQQRVSAAT